MYWFLLLTDKYLTPLNYHPEHIEVELVGIKARMIV